MLRRALYLPAVLLWSVLLLPIIVLCDLVTLHSRSHRWIEVFAGVWGRGMLWISGVRLRVIGREHLTPRRSRILVMNHSSFLDMQALAALNPPSVVALAKREFFWIPLLGQAMWATGQVFVNRRDPVSARASLDQLAAAMAHAPRTVVIFPEGTRSRDGLLHPFKTGAFRLALKTGAPLLPVVLHGAYARQRPQDLRPRPGEITLVIHPEISPLEWREDGLHAVADGLHGWFQARLDEGPPA